MVYNIPPTNDKQFELLRTELINMNSAQLENEKREAMEAFDKFVEEEGL